MSTEKFEDNVADVLKHWIALKHWADAWRADQGRQSGSVDEDSPLYDHVMGVAPSRSPKQFLRDGLPPETHHYFGRIVHRIWLRTKENQGGGIEAKERESSAKGKTKQGKEKKRRTLRKPSIRKFVERAEPPACPRKDGHGGWEAWETFWAEAVTSRPKTGKYLLDEILYRGALVARNYSNLEEASEAMVKAMYVALEYRVIDVVRAYYNRLFGEGLNGSEGSLSGFVDFDAPVETEGGSGLATKGSNISDSMAPGPRERAAARDDFAQLDRFAHRWVEGMTQDEKIGIWLQLNSHSINDPLVIALYSQSQATVYQKVKDQLAVATAQFLNLFDTIESSADVDLCEAFQITAQEALKQWISSEPGLASVLLQV